MQPSSNHHHHHQQQQQYEYPNLVSSCSVTVLPDHPIIDVPPVRLPTNILQMVSSPLESIIPKPIDFTIEHKILQKKLERDQEFGISNSQSDKDDLRHNLIARMKSLTNASEDVCVSILQRNLYDLETSVEAYLSNSQSQL